MGADAGILLPPPLRFVQKQDRVDKLVVGRRPVVERSRADRPSSWAEKRTQSAAEPS